MPIRVITPVPKIPACNAVRAEELFNDIAKALKVRGEDLATLWRRVIALATEHRERVDAEAGSPRMKQIAGWLDQALPSTRTLINALEGLGPHIDLVGPTKGWPQAIEGGSPRETPEDAADRELIDRSLPIFKELRSMLKRRAKQHGPVIQGALKAYKMRHGPSVNEYLGLDCCKLLEEYRITPTPSERGALRAVMQSIHEIATGKAHDMRKVAEEVCKQRKQHRKPSS